MESNDESSSKLIEEVVLTSEDEEEILIYSDSTNESIETARSKFSELETKKIQLVYEDISINTNDSDINHASESNFIIPDSDSDLNTFELIQDEEEFSKTDSSSNNDVTDLSSMNIVKASATFKHDENNNINTSLVSTSTPSSDNSRILNRFNDFKLFQPCSVILKRVTESVIQSFKPKTKRKYEISYKRQSDEESVCSNTSNWSPSRKKKHHKEIYQSFNSLNASISTSSASSVQNKNKNKTKKPKRGRKKKDSFSLSTEPKMSEFLNEETNSGFDSSNYVCQLSNNESIKLKICKTQKEIQCENEDSSNHTIVLASSRSNSPTRSEQADSRIALKSTSEVKSDTKNEENTVQKKSNDLLKTTLKKQNTKANPPTKNKNIIKPKLDVLKKSKENVSLKKSIIENITDIAIDRSYKIPKLNRKEDICNDLKSNDTKPQKVTNGKSKKKNKKKNFEKKQTKEKQTTNGFQKENNFDYSKKKINKYRKTLELMSRDQIPKLKDLQKKRAEFNQSIGAKYPYFGISFMIDEYIKKISTVACLDFDLLINNSPVDDSELSITSLNREEQIQLCRLMSRSAGRVNTFELVNMDPLLREYPEFYDNSLSGQLDSDKEEENFLNSIDEMTLSEAFILYKRLILRLNSPYRNVEIVKIANSENHTLYVTFENDFEIDSLNSSIESIVNSSLHKPLKKFKTLKSDIHLNSVYTDENSNSSNQKLSVSNQNYDSIRIKLNDDELVNKMYTKSVYEKCCFLKMPKDFYKICNTEKYPKPKNDDTTVQRFLGHRTRIRRERGEMRLANRHKILSDYELEERLLRLQTEQEIQIDLSQLKNNSVI